MQTGTGKMYKVMKRPKKVYPHKEMMFKVLDRQRTGTTSWDWIPDCNMIFRITKITSDLCGEFEAKCVFDNSDCTFHGTSLLFSEGAVVKLP